MTDPLPLETLMRLAADGELSENQAAALAAMLRADPDLADQMNRRLDMEQRLKNLVVRVMGGVVVPDAMTSRIHAALAEAREDDHEVEREAAGEPARRIAGRIGPAQTFKAGDGAESAKRQRRAGLWLFAGPIHANAAAVAATLALVVGAVLFGIYGRTIDDVARRPATTEIVSDAAVFASAEHDRVQVTTEQLQEMCSCDCPIDAKDELGELMGRAVQIPDLIECGYGFEAMRLCQSPAGLRGPAAQLVYRKLGGPKDRKPLASLIVLPDGDGCSAICTDLATGEWSAADGGSDCHRTVLRRHDGKFIYLLVCCDPEDLPELSAAIARTGGCGAK